MHPCYVKTRTANINSSFSLSKLEFNSEMFKWAKFNVETDGIMNALDAVKDILNSENWMELHLHTYQYRTQINWDYKEIEEPSVYVGRGDFLRVVINNEEITTFKALSVWIEQYVENYE